LKNSHSKQITACGVLNLGRFHDQYLEFGLQNDLGAVNKLTRIDFSFKSHLN
jgi:hypothetical protein